MSRILLCLRVGSPPVGQCKACSALNADPHTHLGGSLDSCQPYRRQIASRKADFDRSKPCFLNGRAESQFDAPFSFARLTALCRLLGSCSLTAVALSFSCMSLCLVSCSFDNCSGYRAKSTELVPCCINVQTKLDVKCWDATNSLDATSERLIIPRPPYRTGRESNSHSVPGSGRPVNDGKNMWYTASPSGWNFADIWNDSS